MIGFGAGDIPKMPLNLARLNTTKNCANLEKARETDSGGKISSTSTLPSLAQTADALKVLAGRTIDRQGDLQP